MDPFNPPHVSRRMNYSVADFYHNCQKRAEQERMKRQYNLLKEMEAFTEQDIQMNADPVIEIFNEFTKKLNHI